MEINTKYTTEVQFFYFKDREHQLIWYDLTQNQTHPRSYAHIYVIKFGANWFIFVDVREKTKSSAANFHNSRPNNSSCSGPIGPIIELIQILLDINVLPKFVLTGLHMQMIECKQSQMYVFFFFK